MRFINCYSRTTTDVSEQQIWAIWSDINKRHIWDSDTEWAKIDGEFAEGNCFQFKIKGGPKLKMEITECTPNHSFTDCFKMPLAKLYGIHELFYTDSGLEIKTTILVQGPLAFLWQKIIGNNVVKSLPEQTELLIEAARNIKIEA